ncbi:HD domain-containing protein (plasmid) [Nocardia sp. CA-084685]|uniref:HD domain-containing protein n=1 Tax=Nocardia sp. CA-084685 TaxID=3239970 RepID=UPI003D998A56
MGAPIGFDWDWASSTGGLISRRQCLQLIAVLLTQMPGLVSGELEVVGGVHGTGRLDGAALVTPSTSVAVAAERIAREQLSPWLLEHSFRCYFFGKALAGVDGAVVDDELAFVAAMLHDIELERPVRGRCFAVRGAEDAEKFLSELGEPSERVTLVRDGIAQHITPGLDGDIGDVAVFLSQAASVDLFGARVQDLDPGWITSLLAEHPRLDFKREVIRVLREEVARTRTDGWR